MLINFGLRVEIGKRFDVFKEKENLLKHFRSMEILQNYHNWAENMKFFCEKSFPGTASREYSSLQLETQLLWQWHEEEGFNKFIVFATSCAFPNIQQLYSPLRWIHIFYHRKNIALAVPLYPRFCCETAFVGVLWKLLWCRWKEKLLKLWIVRWLPRQQLHTNT